MVDDSNHSLQRVPSLPEDVQMVLTVRDGELRQGGVELSAAALIELALQRRIGSVPAKGLFGTQRGFFGRGNSRKLTVLDPKPTGDPSLDGALGALLARGRPWRPVPCVKKLGSRIGVETQNALIRRGAIERRGRVGGWRTTLRIADEQQREESLRRLNAAWRVPHRVTDPRSGAFVDVLRCAGPEDNRRASREPILEWEWYPEDVHATIVAILTAERLTSDVYSGGGYEG